MGEQATFEFDFTFGDILLHKLVKVFKHQFPIANFLKLFWRLQW